MRIRCLGVFTIDDRVLRPCRRVKLLAILLLNAGSTVSTERLMSELWEGTDPAARNALHAQIVRLRHDLAKWTGPDGVTIRTEFPGYQVDLGAACLDVTEFQALAARSRELRRQDPHTALATARRALAMWDGGAFTGLALGPTGTAAKARLEESRFALLLDSHEIMLDLGEHHYLVADLQELTVQHPFCEPLQRQLMIALYRSGRIGEVLRVNETVRHRFARDLGVDPSPEFSQLLTDILRHDPSLWAPSIQPWH